MLDEISIRPVVLEDLDALAALYTRHWFKNVTNPMDKLLAGRYNVLIQLMRSPLALVAEWGGSVVGVCLGCRIRDGRSSVVSHWLPAYEETLSMMARRWDKTTGDYQGGSFSDDEYELELANSFIASGSPFAEAQLNLFMVEPSIKGRGVGNKLLEHMFALMRSEGATRFFLMTDTASDYTFYEHRGLELLHTYPDGSDDLEPWDRKSWAILLYGGTL